MIVCNALKVAQFVASVKHAGQVYSNGLPYTHHLAAVESVVRRFKAKIIDSIPEGADLDLYDAILVASWLHDIVEDTGMKVKDVEELFGSRIAWLVDAVTNEPGENRKVRNALTYPKIRRGGWAAVALKLADRIANVEAGGSMLKKYRQEYEDFKRALYTQGENEAMWAHLDGLMIEGAEAKA